MKCINCGNENKNTNIKCDFCGHVLQNLDNDIFENEVKDTKEEIIKTEKSYNYYLIFSGILLILTGLYIIFSTRNYYTASENILIIFGLAVGAIAITIIILGISLIYKGVNTKKLADRVEQGENVNITEIKKVENVYAKSYRFIYNAQTLIFTILWFAFISFITYILLKTDDVSFEYIIIVVPFWLFGFYLLYKLYNDTYKRKK